MQNQMRAQLLSLGLTAPGLVNFASFKAMMQASETPEVSEPLEKYSPSFLPANERRRTTATIKLALKTAEEALFSYQTTYPDADSQIPVLFVCKDGDTMITARMCQAVSEEEPMISPTQFHNSVHNAPAGYWMIGQENQAPASAISVGENAIANGLLEAVLQSQSENKPVLMVIYDLPIDESMPIKATEKSKLPFAFAMVLDANKFDEKLGLPIMNLSISPEADHIESVEQNFYQGVPAAEAYSLLKAIALYEPDKPLLEMSYPLNQNNFIKLFLS